MKPAPSQHTLLVISGSLKCQRKILEGLMKRASKRELAHNPGMAEQRLRHIAWIDEAEDWVNAMLHGGK